MKMCEEDPRKLEELGIDHSESDEWDLRDLQEAIEDD